MSNFSWSESLDQMLAKLNNGDFSNQSIQQFKDEVEKDGSFENSTNIPEVNSTILVSTYQSRYGHISACLNNILFNKYPQEKRNGFDQVIERYRLLLAENKNNMKVVEQSIMKDISAYYQRVRNVQVDSFLTGYYDGLILVLKVITASKDQKFKQLYRKVRF